MYPLFHITKEYTRLPVFQRKLANPNDYLDGDEIEDED